MSLITYNGLVRLVEDGVITGVTPDDINGASIDITIGEEILIESSTFIGVAVDLAKKKSPPMCHYTISDDGYPLTPGSFILAHSTQTFNLPNNVACEYKLKSSLARAGLGHALAGWCDPGWHGSHLTLELHNQLSYHPLIIRPGMKIGQMIFFEGEEVPADRSYRARGQYNHDRGAVQSKGVR